MKSITVLRVGNVSYIYRCAQNTGNVKHYLILILGLFIISCSSQGEEYSNQEGNTLTVNLNTFYNQQDRGLLILYPITEMEDSLHRRITFPDLSELLDTAFAQIYFTGNNQSVIENGILVLIGDHSSESPLFWVDYNNDLNFPEGNEPLLFSEEFIDVSIPNHDQPDLYHSIRFYKSDSVQKDQTNKMIEQYITKGKPYTDFYFDQRRNIRVGDFVYKQDSVRIGIMDFNVNGKYNDLRSDRIVIGKYGGSINGTDEASGAVVLDSSTYFHSTNYGFELIKAADNGASISIKPTFSDNTESRVAVGQPFSDYAFELISGQKTSIHDFLDGQNYLYLNFWASWCAGCHQEIQDLERIYTNYPDKVKIISLNYNEDSTEIKPFIDKYQITWINGLSTSEINEELFIDGLPRNILIDPSGKIIKMNIHPSELLNQIDEL
jgi:thiol-disulfide isomerase/thioredoxin